MIRKTVIIPGNDCIYGACRVRGCPGYTGLENMYRRGHGLCGEEWIYIVRDGGPYATLTDGRGPALSLMVMTDILPLTVPKDHSARCGTRCGRCPHAWHRSQVCECGCPADPLADLRRGADISLHEIAADGRPCEWLGGPCEVNNSSALAADEFFRRHGDPAQAEQNEAFWLALEAKLVGWSK